MVKGLKLEFIKSPHQHQIPKQYNMKKEHEQLLDIEIQKLLKNHTIKKTVNMQGQFISPIFLKLEESKNRPIINFKQLNNFIPYRKFKMETFTDLKELIQQGDLMIKIDLKEAYTRVPLNQEQGNNMKFTWKGQIYQCLTMFFGMGPAPRCFTKLMKVPMSLLRRLQIRMMIYIDDIIIMAQQEKHILMARDTTLYLLESLGLTVNYAKSVLKPEQKLEYLGIEINTQMMNLKLPERKVKQL